MKTEKKVGEMFQNGQYTEVKMDWGKPQAIKEEKSVGALVFEISAFLVAFLALVAGVLFVWQFTVAGDCRMGLRSAEECEQAKEIHRLMEMMLM